MDVEDRIVVITGGASGIGLGIATALARRGARLVIADIDAARSAAAREVLEALGAAVMTEHCDVTSDNDLDALAARVREAWGPADVVFNNAGVAIVSPHPDKVSIDEWRTAIDIDLFSVVRGVRAFVPAMLERGSGWVVNTASIAGFYINVDHQTVYSALKFAVRGYTEGLAMSLPARGVGVPCLASNFVTTNIGDGVRLLGSSDWSTVSAPEGLRPITPDEAGEIVAQGLEEERYLILTHPEERKVIAELYAELGHPAGAGA